MSLSDIERKYADEKGNKPIIQLPKEHVLFLQSIRTIAWNWLEIHPYSRSARRVARREYADIRVGDVVKLLKVAAPEILHEDSPEGELARKFLA